jgi:predicted TIM-barrel fold metal-dependent hydrolase
MPTLPFTETHVHFHDFTHPTLRWDWIVAYADLADPQVEQTLERHAAFANLRGIRDLRYDDYLTNEDWLRGFSTFSRFDLVCCDDPALEQYGLAADLALRHPDTVLRIDHAGFPRQRDREYLARWRDGLQRLAKAPNVVIKVSGLGQVDHRWTVDTLRPIVLGCIEAFGVKRCFFGTNWPVDRLFSSYGDLLDAYAEIISGFSAAEQQALFSENANRIFDV